MKCVVCDSSKITYDQGIILEEQAKFYKSLYSHDPKIKFSILCQNQDPMLSDEFRDKCDRALTIHELYDAVMTLKANKVGGSDGLSAEFYKTFFHELKELLLNMYLHAYESNTLH